MTHIHTTNCHFIATTFSLPTLKCIVVPWHWRNKHITVLFLSPAGNEELNCFDTKEMHHKVFAGLKHTTFPPIKKFPQLSLRNDAQFQLRIPFSQLSTEDEGSLLSVPPLPEVAETSPIVEIRSSDKRRLLGLGFVDAHNANVSCFHLTRPSAMLPVIDNQYFSDKLALSFHRRRSVLPNETTAYRGVHGGHDLLPALEIDHFCSSFSRIRCSNRVGERLLPIAAEFLQERGAEVLLISSPSIPTHRLSLVKSSMPEAKPYYQEDSIQYLWDGHEYSNSDAAQVSHRWYLDLAFRRARLMVRNIAAGKKCLCLGDTAAGMALNACLQAEHVCVVEENAGYRKWVRQNIAFNHGTRIFDSKISLHSSLHSVVGGDSPAPPPSLFDIITVEVIGSADDDLLQKFVRVAAAGAKLIVQFTGTSSDAVALTQSVGRVSLQHGRSACKVNELSSSSIDFPTHTLAALVDSSSISASIFTFLVD